MKAWKNQFGHKHGVILVRRFWENVAPKNYKTKPKLTVDLKEKDNIIIRFEPDDAEWMLGCVLVCQRYCPFLPNPDTVSNQVAQAPA